MEMMNKLNVVQTRVRFPQTIEEKNPSFKKNTSMHHMIQLTRVKKLSMDVQLSILHWIVGFS
jgi:hypothetical protein